MNIFYQKHQKSIVAGFLLIWFLLGFSIAWGQGRGDYRIMFYNVENLFDTLDEPDRNDDEFTPEGARYWTDYRLRKKLVSLYKVIAAAGEWSAPEVIGLCEVENRQVLERLRDETPLKTVPYRIIHRHSPDRRGIDVALMYRTDRLTILDSAFFTVVFPGDLSIRTREILYAKGVATDDTLHFFVNHWPSRIGGAVSEYNRHDAGKLLRSKVDSIFSIQPLAKVILMGDFNDEPPDRSLTDGLGALITMGNNPSELYNLMAPLKQSSNFHTHKYQGQWTMLDQFIVSGSLLLQKKGMYTRPDAASIFYQDWMLTEDELHPGKRPFRTYDGYRYSGGFSDHLPVILDLWIGR